MLDMSASTESLNHKSKESNFPSFNLNDIFASGKKKKSWSQPEVSKHQTKPNKDESTETKDALPKPLKGSKIILLEPSDFPPIASPLSTTSERQRKRPKKTTSNLSKQSLKRKGPGENVSRFKTDTRETRGKLHHTLYFDKNFNEHLQQNHQERHDSSEQPLKDHEVETNKGVEPSHREVHATVSYVDLPHRPSPITPRRASHGAMEGFVSSSAVAEELLGGSPDAPTISLGNTFQSCFSFKCGEETRIISIGKQTTSVSYLAPTLMRQEGCHKRNKLPPLSMRHPMKSYNPGVCAADYDKMDFIYHSVIEDADVSAVFLSTDGGETPSKLYLLDLTEKPGDCQYHFHEGEKDSKAVVWINSEKKKRSPQNSKVMTLKGMKGILPYLYQNNLFLCLHYHYSETEDSAEWSLEPIRVTNFREQYTARQNISHETLDELRQSNIQLAFQFRKVKGSANIQEHVDVDDSLDVTLLDNVTRGEFMKNMISIRCELVVNRFLWYGMSARVKSRLLCFAHVVEDHLARMIVEWNTDALKGIITNQPPSSQTSSENLCKRFSDSSISGGYPSSDASTTDSPSPHRVPEDLLYFSHREGSTGSVSTDSSARRSSHSPSKVERSFQDEVQFAASNLFVESDTSRTQSAEEVTERPRTIQRLENSFQVDPWHSLKSSHVPVYRLPQYMHMPARSAAWDSFMKLLSAPLTENELGLHLYPKMNDLRALLTTNNDQTTLPFQETNTSVYVKNASIGNSGNKTCLTLKRESSSNPVPLSAASGSFIAESPKKRRKLAPTVNFGDDESSQSHLRGQKNSAQQQGQISSETRKARSGEVVSQVVDKRPINDLVASIERPCTFHGLQTSQSDEIGDALARNTELRAKQPSKKSFTPRSSNKKIKLHLNGNRDCFSYSIVGLHAETREIVVQESGKPIEGFAKSAKDANPIPVDWYFASAENLPSSYCTSTYPIDNEVGLYAVGVRTYLQVFTEEEIRTIEKRMDALYAKSLEVPTYLLPETCQHSHRPRQKKIARTKMFFNARYLWTKDQMDDKNSSVAKGIRTDVSPSPNWMAEEVATKLEKQNIIPENFVNSFACNIYHDGSEGLGQHFDDTERFKHPVVSIRLFSDSRLGFGCKLFGYCNGDFAIPMPRGTITVLKDGGFASVKVKHCIRPADMSGKSGVLILRQIHKNLIEEANKLKMDELSDLLATFSFSVPSSCERIEDITLLWLKNPKECESLIKKEVNTVLDSIIGTIVHAAEKDEILRKKEWTRHHRLPNALPGTIDTSVSTNHTTATALTENLLRTIEYPITTSQ